MINNRRGSAMIFIVSTAFILYSPLMVEQAIKNSYDILNKQ